MKIDVTELDIFYISYDESIAKRIQTFNKVPGQNVYMELAI